MYKIFAVLIFLSAPIMAAIPADFDGDDIVSLPDLILFCADWLNESPHIDTPEVDLNADDVVNMDDFAIFARYWLMSEVKDITALDSESNIITHILHKINLAISTYNPDPKEYVITKLPARGHLRDPLCFACSPIASVPYTLRYGGHTVCYETVSGPDTYFEWKAITTDTQSNTATADLKISGHPKDHLSMGKEGIITIADDDLFDLTGNRGIALFIKTHIADAPILKKTEAGKGGYDLSLYRGSPRLRIFRDGSLEKVISLESRVNDGTWWAVGFAYDPTESAVDLHAEKENKSETHDWSGWIEITDDDYTNDADLIIGDGYVWDIDNIRSYDFTTYTVNTYVWENFVDQTREEAGDEYAPLGITIYPKAAVRFHCDFDGVNNNPAQIYDDFANHFTGAINSKRYVRYYPYFIDPCINN